MIFYTMLILANRRSVCLLASICQGENGQEDSGSCNTISVSSSAFLRGVYSCALDTLQFSTDEQSQRKMSNNDENDVIVLDLLALLLGFLHTFSAPDLKKLLTVEHREDHTEFRAALEAKLASASDAKGEPEEDGQLKDVAGDIKHFLMLTDLQ